MIRIRGLRKVFGTFTAVDDLSFDINRNEIFGLLGPNGAGKTTTISMICGLVPPSGGEIIFEDQAGSDRRSLIGYCPQENIFYPKLTCLEQLIFMGQMYGAPQGQARSKALELLDQLGLGDKTNVLAAKLSGGMKRRLNICLALVRDPGILILDEPEAGLDPQSRILVRDFIRSYGRLKTVILTTHNMDEADRLAGRVAIIDHGRLLLLDTPRNLKRTVGEGDILELVVEGSSDTVRNDFAAKALQLGMEIKFSEDSVLIRHADITGLIPAVRSAAEEAGLKINELRLRENTLEDVFIHLTGRSLRQ